MRGGWAAMLEEAAQLAGELTPYATAAIGAYGTAVLTRVEDGAADATVSFGGRLLRRLTGRSTDPAEDQEPTAEQSALARTIAELAESPADADALAALRVQIRRLLADDPALAAEIAGWPRPPAPASVVISTSGERSPAVHTNYGTIHTGDATPDTTDTDR